MKKIIVIGILLGILLVSLGGCFVPYNGRDGVYRDHGRHSESTDRPEGAR